MGKIPVKLKAVRCCSNLNLPTRNIVTPSNDGVWPYHNLRRFLCRSARPRNKCGVTFFVDHLPSCPIIYGVDV